jgi:hypothetical protein
MADITVSADDYVEYYSATWNTVTVVAPSLGVTLKYDASAVARAIPAGRRLEFFCHEIGARLSAATAD